MRLTLGKLGSGALLAVGLLSAIAAVRQTVGTGPLGPDPRGTLVDGALALLIGWLLTRSFSSERSMTRALSDLKETTTARITEARLEVATLQGQLMEVDKRLDAQRLSLEALEKRRDADRETERSARHALANQWQETFLGIEERIRELAEGQARLEGERRRTR